MGWEKKTKKYPLRLFSKLGWGSYCRLCIHYCFPLVPPHQYGPEKIWCGGTFHWQSMSGWVDSVLIWDNGASHVWLTPLGHIGVSSTPSGCVNGLGLHWGTGCFLCVRVCVCVWASPNNWLPDQRERENKGEKQGPSLTMLLFGWEHYRKDMQQWMSLFMVCGCRDILKTNLILKIWVHA